MHLLFLGIAYAALWKTSCKIETENHLVPNFWFRWICHRTGRNVFSKIENRFFKLKTFSDQLKARLEFCGTWFSKFEKWLLKNSRLLDTLELKLDQSLELQRGIKIADEAGQNYIWNEELFPH